MSELNHECGVAAVYHLSTGEASSHCPPQGRLEVSRLIPRMLLDLQNRGQLSAGFTTYNPDRKQLIDTHKDAGTVTEVFHLNQRPVFHRLMDDYAGRAAIGHVRYAATGQDDRSFAQPFERHHIKKYKWFSFAFNGQLANFDQLKLGLLKDDNTYLARENDTEILMHFLCGAIKESASDDLLEVCKKLTSQLDGTYNFVFLNARGEMFVARDPLGIKPLCYAFDGSLFAAASESVALFNLGFKLEDIKNVEPGQVIIVNEEGIRFERFASSPRTAHCFFEWAYFANVASTLDGRSVYMARKNLGEELAAIENVPLDDDCIVVPVPDTSKAAADGLAYALRIPCMEGLIRNRYSGRTFIEGGEYRWRKAETKYTPLEEVLQGKRIFLVEDSIVRSTTMRVLIQRIRSVGKAREIHVRVACPPIIGPCFYGTDMSTYSELFATEFFDRRGLPVTEWTLTPEILEEMRADIGADSLQFLPIRSMSKAIGIPVLNLCQACINGDYPTVWGCRLAEAAKKKYDEGLKQRTYEIDSK